MERFAHLLDRLAFTPSRKAKLTLIADYVATVPDPDRGYALAALTGGLRFRHAGPALVRSLAEARVDPVLFRLSYDYVGDLAETVALIWPARRDGHEHQSAPAISQVVERLAHAGKSEVPALLEGWLDRLDAAGRLALIKLITGALRIGVSARLAKTALAQVAGRPVDEIEEIWHGLAPPYAPLFDWIAGRGPRPEPKTALAFRPPMLAHPLTDADFEDLAPADFAAEWKWDGIRVQLAGDGESARLFTRTGDDIGHAFPDIVQGLKFHGSLDGELLVRTGAEVQPFASLQKRLNRKSAGPKLLNELPAAIRLYDCLFDGAEDLRPQPFAERRRRLERLVAALGHPRFDLSQLVAFGDWAELASLRAASGEPGVEGLMLKRRDSPYLAGRPRGHWFKWKRDPFLIDAVLMYAQRGHGRRSSFYSDYTFGLWREDRLLPVGKAYFGFTDEELAMLDRWVRNNTRNRFGPVREVAPGLVLEVAFEGLQRSGRHKSGVALRFPRINRIRWDKPAADADRLETLEDMLGPDGAS